MADLTRRRFLRGAATAAAVGLGVTASLHDGWWRGRSWEEATPVEPPTPWSIEARYATSLSAEIGTAGSPDCARCHGASVEALPVSYCHTPHSGDVVHCDLCPHGCVLADGERGICRVRENRGGKLFSLVYGNPCAVHIDPIEKKPFYHVLPTATAFSLATAGCNLRCLYCQNWPISQTGPEGTENADIKPEAVVRHAQEAQAPVIAYTYSEPIVFYEYMLDTARLAHDAGLRNVVISAGFINPEPLRGLCAVVDAVKIDLKGYDANFYREVCSGELAPVLEAIRTIHASGTHLEIVNLVVPTLNDDLAQLRDLARWLADEISPGVPLHFSRFHPQYRLKNLPPTPVETLDAARRTALEAGVRYVYVGNVPGHPGNQTTCHACSAPIIVRQGFIVSEYHLANGRCAFCGAPIPGIWWGVSREAPPVVFGPGAVEE